MNRITPRENTEIKGEVQQAIDDLKEKGVNFNSSSDDINGLGDLVEATLTKFGITEERFKKWFNLRECNCKERKKWLNNLFSWKHNNQL
jgi:hypothetical protein|tara:strand:+ start:312 stop:578 length:267 start_codon:yes stop_codon:yes gene_type:complete